VAAPACKWFVLILLGESGSIPKYQTIVTYLTETCKWQNVLTWKAHYLIIYVHHGTRNVKILFILEHKMSGTISVVKNFPSSLLQCQGIAVLGNQICLPNATPEYELLDKTTGASLGISALTIGGNNFVVSNGLDFFIASTGGGGDGGITAVSGGVTHTGVGSGPFGMGTNGATVYAGGRDSGNLYTAGGGSFPVAPSGLASTCPNIISVGGFLWAVQNNGIHDILWQLNAGGGVVNSFALGFHAFGLTSDGVSLWLTDGFGGNLKQVSFAGVVIGTFPLPLAEPSRIIFDGQYLWIGDFFSGLIVVFDTDGNLQASTAIVGASNLQCFTLDGSNVWATYEDGATLSYAAQFLFTPDVIPSVLPSPFAEVGPALPLPFCIVKENGIYD